MRGCLRVLLCVGPLAIALVSLATFPPIAHATPYDDSPWENLCNLTGIEDPEIVRLSPDGSIACVHDREGYMAELWDVRNESLASTLAIGGTVTDVEFSPDGRYIAVGRGPGFHSTGLLVFWASNGTEVPDTHFHTVNSTDDIAWSWVGDSIAVGTREGELFIVDATSWQVSASKRFTGAGSIVSLAFSPDDTTLALLASNGTCTLLDPATLERIADLEGTHTNSICELSWSFDGRYLCGPFADSEVAVYNASTRSVVRRFQLRSASFSPTGGYLEVGYGAGSAEVLDIVDWERVALLMDWPGEVNLVSWSGDGNSIALGSTGDTTVRVFVDTDSPAYDDPPRVNVTSHASGDRVSNTVVVSGTASDDGGVESVLYSVDDGPWRLAIGLDNWSFEWDTRFHANGSHTVHVRAFDGSSLSPTVSLVLVVENNASTLTPPLIEIDVPIGGTAVAGEVLFAGRAWGPNRVASVELTILDTLVEADVAGSNWSATVDTRDLPDGYVTFQAIAFDGLLRSLPAIVNLTVDNVNSRPFARIHYPEEGQVFNFTFMARGNAADEERSLEFVLVRIDEGPWLTPEPVNGWIYDWVFTYDSWSLENGEHTLQVMCADDVQVSEIVQVNFTVDNDWDHPRGRPNLEITSPVNGSTAAGTVEIRGTADNGPLIQEIRVSIDGGEAVVAEGTVSWSLAVDTLAHPDGVHTVRAWAVGVLLDSEVDELELVFDNDRRPECGITWPVDDQTLVEDTVVRGTVLDPDGGPVTVEISVDSGGWSPCVVEGGNWSYAWNVTDLEEGRHTLEVRAYDGGQYSPTDSVSVEVVLPDRSRSPEPDVALVPTVLIIILVILVVILSFAYLFRARGA